MRVHALNTVLAACGLAAAGCHGGRAESPFVVNLHGSPERGAAVIRDADCGSCHTIPGIRGARGTVGPPLYFMARRTYIAGRVPNQPENLMRWIKEPQAIDPLTAMPDLNLDDQQVRDAAAYLYTLD